MCEHKRLKCVDNVLSCMDCGSILPLEALTERKDKTLTETAAEAPKKPRKRAKKEG